MEPPTDAKVLLAAFSILLAGFMKGVSGMGLPVVATPVLAMLYDLPSAIAVTMPATLLTDFPMLYAFRAEWRQARRLVPIAIPGALGIVLGTRILVAVDPGILRALLGTLVIAFVTVSYFRLLPRFSEPLARRLGPVVAIVAGVLQGSAGQSGPVISMFFYQLELSRGAFLFVINAFFVVVDATQVASLASHGFYTPARSVQALGAVCLAVPSLLLALTVHDRIGEDLFRRVVLTVLGLTGIVLLTRSLVSL